ncbi:hypothetical protein LSM04_007593 [Trypanosoma melophagium]|uniref:uncharacterized protein n=1 Tax=Trypanosoma melophagium TaxID=715481 RepID=UPI00351A9C0E|nr:hypothetical protein LSM04_007593 [Trypanosoma melophagium]
MMGPSVGNIPSPVQSVCSDSTGLQRTSLPFVVFELAMASICTFSYFAMRRMRRISEIRAQQRYDRLSRLEIGFGANNNTTEHVSVV